MSEAIHYSAFISYKHAPADIAVASEIQKHLERYHIPGPIRKRPAATRLAGSSETKKSSQLCGLTP